jgi:hypothetical protein
MRIALKVFPEESQRCFKDNDNADICQANFHYSESADLFPIPNNGGLDIFVNQCPMKHPRDLFRMIMAVIKMKWNHTSETKASGIIRKAF